MLAKEKGSEEGVERVKNKRGEEKEYRERREEYKKLCERKKKKDNEK